MKKTRVHNEHIAELSGHRAWQTLYLFKSSGVGLPQMALVRVQEGFPGKIIQDFSQEFTKLHYFSASQVSLCHFA